jgi:hypothetical protein
MNKYLPNHELYEMYDEMLDSVYDPVKIGAYEYEVSTALRKVDPIAYELGFDEWLDSQIQDEVFIEDSNGSVYLK